MQDQENRYLRMTPLLNGDSPEISALVRERGWRGLSEHDRIGAAYDFVRNEIRFGYNFDDAIPATRVLADGYGQCNTKATLLMAILRALGIPCRLHGFTIRKSLQRGIVPELVYPIAPENIVHTWVEVRLDGRWIDLEGFIVDDDVLKALQRRFAARSDSLCAYGVGTDCLSAPGVEWAGKETYIQKTGINQDFGLYDDPDTFYLTHGQDLGWFRGLLFRYIIRRWMNRRVEAMRGGDIPHIPARPKNEGSRHMTRLEEAK